MFIKFIEISTTNKKQWIRGRKMAFKDKYFRSILYTLLMGIFVISTCMSPLKPGFFGITNEKEEFRLGVVTYVGFGKLKYLAFFFCSLKFYCTIQFTYTESQCTGQLF